MKLANLLETQKPVLTEQKMRIPHPEDMIFDKGLAGAIAAMRGLQATANSPQNISVKFDGSPALIFGWQNNDFVLTDKYGFGKQGGMPTSPEAVEQMIMNRNVPQSSPEDAAQRRQYANKIASLYYMLRAATPPSFQGYAQGDLLWTGIPRIKNGFYEFKPDKMLYRIPVNSKIGNKISKGKAGIAIHSVYTSQNDEEPSALRDIKKKGFREVDGLVILPHEVNMPAKLAIDTTRIHHLGNLIKNEAANINAFFDPSKLMIYGIKSLPARMKSFLAFKASKGDADYDNLADEFQTWVKQGANGTLSSRMMTRILMWINEHADGYHAIWRIVKLITEIKLKLKSRMDARVHGIVDASLRQKTGHEGFVSVTPDGTIKFVDRSEFMKKDPQHNRFDETLVESTDSESDDEKVVWCFLRANPPTLGHRLVINKVAELAGEEGDYWIFLSHSHDNKKNPLDWQTKMDFMKRIMPKKSAHFFDQEEIKTPIKAADWLYEHGYRDMILVCGSDRVDSMRELLTSWNSDQVRAKYNRDPVKIKVVSAGDRDPDAKGVKGISGTKAREAVADNDMMAFEKSTGLHGELAKELFAAVKANSGLQGLAKAVKALKEHANPYLHPHGTIVMLKMTEDCAHRFSEWCSTQNIPCIPKEDMHITVLYSKTPVPHLESMHGNTVRVVAKPKDWKVLGEKALTMVLECPIAEQFHQSLRKQGGTHGFPEYIVHTTANYDWTDPYTPHNIPPFPLIYDRIEVLPIDPDFKPGSK